MAKPTEFNIDGKTPYIFWNTPSANSPTRIIPPKDTQAVAVTWDSKALKFTPIYFTDIQVNGEPLPSDVKANGTIVGTHNGADVFIISLPGKQVRDDLSKELNVWVQDFELRAEVQKLLVPGKPRISLSDAAKRRKRIERLAAIGRFIAEIEKHIGKSKTPAPEKPAGVAPAAVVEPARVEEQPKVVAQPAPPPVAPPIVLPVTIAPASREVAVRVPPATQQPDADPTLDDLRPAAVLPQGDPGKVVYTGTVASRFGQRGFAHIRLDRDQVVPGQDPNRDLFVHITTIPAHLNDAGTVKLVLGDRIAFHAGLDHGKVQVTKVLDKVGEAVPAATVQQSAREPEQRRASEIGAPTTIDTVTHDAIMVAQKNRRIYVEELRFLGLTPDRIHAIFVLDSIPKSELPTGVDHIFARVDDLKTYPGVNLPKLKYGDVVVVAYWENPITNSTEILPSAYDPTLSDTPPARPQKADGSPIIYARPARDRGNDNS